MRAPRLLLLACVVISISCGGLSQAAGSITGTPPALQPSPTLTTAVAATPVPPAFVPPQCADVPLATLPAATTVAQPTAELQANPDVTTEAQLTVLNGLANAVQAHYVYPEAINDEWLARVDESRRKIEGGLDTEAFYSEMHPLVTSLGDDHSYYQSPQEISDEKASLAGIYNVVGIGALFLPLIEKGWPTILVVLDGSPAAHAGLHPHDVVLAVDGMPIGEPGLVHREWTRGPECSAVVLTVRSPGQKPRDLTLIRASVTAPLEIDARLVSTLDGSRIGYIFLPTFQDKTIGDQVGRALESFGPLDGLVLDNRMNGGGLGSVAEQILGFFTSGLAGHYTTREGVEPLEIKADPIGNSEDVPLVILIGKNTVSYGELFSGILHDIGRARLVGQTTLGNVEQLRAYDFLDGSRAWLASARFGPRNSEADWEAEGIVPDVEVIAEWDSFTFETDPGVAAALRLLGH